MKKFTSAMITVVALVLCFTLSACGTEYQSKHSTTAMISSNAPDKASVSFGSFEGTYVMKFQTNGKDKVALTYEATLGEGKIKVFYDFNGEKLDLFEIGTNGKAEDKTEPFTGNKTIYVILESDGTCTDGSFSFALKKA